MPRSTNVDALKSELYTTNNRLSGVRTLIKRAEAQGDEARIEKHRAREAELVSTREALKSQISAAS